MATIDQTTISDVISDDLDFDPITIGHEPDFLNVPLEIRRSIYRYLFEFDKDIDVSGGRGPMNIDLTILHLCRQLRAEALDYLSDSNTWTRLTAYDHVDLSDKFSSVPQVPVNLFTKHESQKLISRTALNFEIGKPPTAQDFASTDCKGDILVCYTVGSQTILCQFLFSPEMQGNAMIVTFAANLMDRKQNIVEGLILPLTRARDSMILSKLKIVGGKHHRLARTLSCVMCGTNSSTKDYQEHMLAMKEEGNKSFAQGHHATALAYYVDGLRVFDQSLPRHEPFNKGLSGAELNVIKALHIDLANNFVHLCNTMLAERRDVNGLFPFESIGQIALTMQQTPLLFGWMGISNQQRQKAHYRRAIAKQNLAEYCSRPAHREYIKSQPHLESTIITDTSILFKTATMDYFYAWQADTNSKSAGFLKSLYQKMCREHYCFASQDPKLVSLSGIADYGDGSWKGDPYLVRSWTEQSMRQNLGRSVPRSSKVTAEQELKQMKEKMGMPGDKLDGLVRLLCIEPSRAT